MLCDVIERSQKVKPTEADPEGGEWKYYVHWHGLNRRMDEWVGTQRIVSTPSVAGGKYKKVEGERKRLEAEGKKEREKKDKELRERREREGRDRGGAGGSRRRGGAAGPGGAVKRMRGRTMRPRARRGRETGAWSTPWR